MHFTKEFLFLLWNYFKKILVLTLLYFFQVSVDTFEIFLSRNIAFRCLFCVWLVKTGNYGLFFHGISYIHQMNFHQTSLKFHCICCECFFRRPKDVYFESILCNWSLHMIFRLYSTITCIVYKMFQTIIMMMSGVRTFQWSCQLLAPSILANYDSILGNQIQKNQSILYSQICPFC